MGNGEWTGLRRADLILFATKCYKGETFTRSEAVLRAGLIGMRVVGSARLCRWGGLLRLGGQDFRWRSGALDEQLLQVLEGRIEEHRQRHGGQEDRDEFVGVELRKERL